MQFLVAAFPDCTILDKWDFYDFILAGELLVKDLRSFESCLSANNNICGKQVLSLESVIMFERRFRVTSVALCYWL